MGINRFFEKTRPYSTFFVIGSLFLFVVIFVNLIIQPALDNYYCLELHGRCSHFDYFDGAPVYVPQENINVWYLKVPTVFSQIIIFIVSILLLKQIGIKRMFYRVILGIAIYFFLGALTALLFSIYPMTVFALPFIFAFVCGGLYYLYLKIQKEIYTK